MGKSARLRAQRRSQKGASCPRFENLTVKEKSAICDHVVEEYMHSFQIKDIHAIALWEVYREVIANYGQSFYLRFVNHPENRESFFLPVSEFDATLENFGLDKRFPFSCIVSDPDALEMARIPPPTLLIVFDGYPDGEFVSQVVAAMPSNLLSAGK